MRRPSHACFSVLALANRRGLFTPPLEERILPMTDGRREGYFDELAKGLASGNVSRRRALKLLGGALLGGVLASVPGVALAAPKPGKGPCRPGQLHCGKKCCPENASCVKGECVCPTGTVLDNGRCVSPSPQQCSFPGTCATGGLGPCGTTSYGATCYCYKTATGAGACLPGRTESGTGVAEEPTCPNGQTDCPTGTVCVVETCGTNPNHCVPVPVSPVCA